MADKTVAVKIDVNAKSLNELEGDLKGINTQIDEIESSAGKLTIEQKFQGAQGAIKLFAGAVEAAVGATILLGVESKVFEEYERYALGVLSFGRGIFDLTEGINDLRKSTVLANVATKANAALNKITAVTMKALGVATNTTSFAFKGLKAAIASTGIGLLIVGLGLLVEKLMTMTSAADKAKAAAERLASGVALLNEETNKATDKEIAAINKTLAARLKVSTSKLDIEKAESQAEEDIYNARVKNLEKKIRLEQAIINDDIAVNAQARKEAQDREAKLKLDLQNIENTHNIKMGKLKAEALIAALAKQDEEREATLKTQNDITVALQGNRQKQIQQVNSYYEELIARAKKYNLDSTALVGAQQQALGKLYNTFTAQDLQRDRLYQEELQFSDARTKEFAITMYEAQTAFIAENTQVRLNLLQQQYDLEGDLLDQERDSQLAQLDERLLNEEITQAEHYDLMLALKKEYEEGRLALDSQTNARARQINEDADDAILQSKLALWGQLAVGFGNLSALFEQGTAAAKTAALAQIAINTAVGYVQGLDIAQKSAAGTGPAAAFAFPIFYATQIAAVLGAAAQAKQVLNTKKAGSTVSTSGAPSTSAASSAASGLKQFNQGPVALPEASSACMRTYVLAGDVTSDQEANAKLSRKRSIA